MRKIAYIERKNSRCAMDLHRRYQSCVVRIHSADAVRHEEHLPFLVYCRGFRDDGEEGFQLSELLPCLFQRQPKAVLLSWPCSGIPKLRENLGRYDEVLSRCY